MDDMASGIFAVVEIFLHVSCLNVGFVEIFVEFKMKREEID